MSTECYTLQETLDNPDTTNVDDKLVRLLVYYADNKIKVEYGYKRKRDDDTQRNGSTCTLNSSTLTPDSISVLTELLDNVPTSLQTTLLLMITKVISVSKFLQDMRGALS